MLRYHLVDFRTFYIGVITEFCVVLLDTYRISHTKSQVWLEDDQAVSGGYIELVDRRDC